MRLSYHPNEKLQFFTEEPILNTFELCVH